MRSNAKRPIIICLLLAPAAVFLWCFWRHNAGFGFTAHRRSILGDAITADDALRVARSFAPAGTRFTIVGRNGQIDKRGAAHSFTLRAMDMTLIISRHDWQAGLDDFDEKRFYGSKYKGLLERHPALPGMTLGRIARRYFRTHCPDASSLNGEHVWARPDKLESQWRLVPSVYTYWFYENTSGLAFSPHWCCVRVESLTGRVTSFEFCRTAITVSRKPCVSVCAAMHTAMHALVIDGRPGPTRRIGVTDPDSSGKERLVYELTFTGWGPPADLETTSAYCGFSAPPSWWWPLTSKRVKHSYAALVDARTGEFLCWGPFAPADLVYCVRMLSRSGDVVDY